MEAQLHRSKGPLGSRIILVRATPIEYLSAHSTKENEIYTYDCAVFAISLWYFSTPTGIQQTLSVIARHARTICVAEWSLAPSKAYHLRSYPHVLAALAQAVLATRAPTGTSTANIRTASSPTSLKDMKEVTGLKCVKELYITPGENNLDSMWEVMEVPSSQWEDEVRHILERPNHDMDKELLFTMGYAVRSALPEPLSKAKGVQSIDFWCATFES